MGVGVVGAGGGAPWTPKSTHPAAPLKGLPPPAPLLEAAPAPPPAQRTQCNIVTDAHTSQRKPSQRLVQHKAAMWSGHTQEGQEGKTAESSSARLVGFRRGGLGDAPQAGVAAGGAVERRPSSVLRLRCHAINHLVTFRRLREALMRSWWRGQGKGKGNRSGARGGSPTPPWISASCPRTSPGWPGRARR